MPLEEYQRKMIDLFMTQEYLLSKIYDAFAEKFEEHGDFWRTISKEELDHAGWIKELREAVDNNEAHFEDNKTRTYTLNTMIEYMEKTLRDAVDGNFSLVQAFAKTTDIENSLIEKKVFEHFKADTEDVVLVLSRLAEATRVHMLKVKNYIQDNKA